jgi:hypothetical protein
MTTPQFPKNGDFVADNIWLEELYENYCTERGEAVQDRDTLARFVRSMFIRWVGGANERQIAYLVSWATEKCSDDQP